MKVLNKFLKNGSGNYVEDVVNGRTGSGPVRSTSCETPHNTFKIASWNIGTMRGRSSEIVETITRRNIDLCCVSVYCAGCSHWVHKKCSGVTGSLKSNPDYRCSRCKGTARPIDGRARNEWLLMQDKKLDVVDSFCYLQIGSVLGVVCDLSVITRIRSAWGKFRELLPILTSRALSYTTRGQIYSTYNLTVLLYASECWAPNVNDLLKLQCNDRAMIRWTCNVRLKDHISSDSEKTRYQQHTNFITIQSTTLVWACCKE